MRRSRLKWGQTWGEVESPTFDFSALQRELRRWAAGHAVVKVNRRSKLIWIFPNSDGSAIHLAVSDEGECDVYAGLTFQTCVIAQSRDSEGYVLDCVYAIATGRAFEHYTFTAINPAGPARMTGAAGLSFSGAFSGERSGNLKRTYRRQIPPWSRPWPAPPARTET